MEKNWIDNGVPKKDTMELAGACLIIDDNKSVLEVTGYSNPFVDINGDYSYPESVEIQLSYIDKNGALVSLKLRKESV